MLLPALNQAREKAKSINCVNNLKQNILAMNMYANSYDDAISFMGTASEGYPSWVNILLASGELTATGSLNCPSAPSADITIIPNTSIYNDIYGVWRVGRYFGTPSIDGATNWYAGISVRLIKHPSNFIIMMDSYNTVEDAQYAYVKASEDIDFAAHAKHNGRMNLAYVDGHVSPLLPAEYKVTVNEMETDGGEVASSTVYYFDGENTTMQGI